MAQIDFRFSYQPDNGANEISAYDAAQALYGIARSLAITTHYGLTGKIIKQAPSISGAKVLVQPPRAGSFEFIAPVVDFIAQPAGPSIGEVITISVASSFIYDLTKLLYRRLCGLSENPETAQLKDVLLRKPGEIDSIADSIEEDVIRLHRPLDGNVFNFHIYGGTNKFGDFDRKTYDFAKTKELGSSIEHFVGNVASLNGNTLNGRFWLADEQRTVGFKEDKMTKLSLGERKLLSWSLNEYVNQRSGSVVISGIALRSKQGLLKSVFVTGVRRA